MSQNREDTQALQRLQQKARSGKGAGQRVAAEDLARRIEGPSLTFEDKNRIKGLFIQLKSENGGQRDFADLLNGLFPRVGALVAGQATVEKLGQCDKLISTLRAEYEGQNRSRRSFPPGSGNTTSHNNHETGHQSFGRSSSQPSPPSLPNGHANGPAMPSGGPPAHFSGQTHSASFASGAMSHTPYQYHQGGNGQVNNHTFHAPSYPRQEQSQGHFQNSAVEMMTSRPARLPHRPSTPSTSQSQGGIRGGQYYYNATQNGAGSAGLGSGWYTGS